MLISNSISSMDKIKEILRVLINDYGSDVLINISKTKGLLSDYLKPLNLEKEVHLITDLLNQNIGKDLLNLLNKSPEQRKIELNNYINYFLENTILDKQMAKEGITIIAEALNIIIPDNTFINIQLIAFQTDLNKLREKTLNNKINNMTKQINDAKLLLNNNSDNQNVSKYINQFISENNKKIKEICNMKEDIFGLSNNNLLSAAEQIQKDYQKIIFELTEYLKKNKRNNDYNFSNNKTTSNKNLEKKTTNNNNNNEENMHFSNNQAIPDTDLHKINNIIGNKYELKNNSSKSYKHFFSECLLSNYYIQFKKDNYFSSVIYCIKYTSIRKIKVNICISKLYITFLIFWILTISTITLIPYIILLLLSMIIYRKTIIHTKITFLFNDGKKQIINIKGIQNKSQKINDLINDICFVTSIKNKCNETDKVKYIRNVGVKVIKNNIIIPW